MARNTTISRRRRGQRVKPKQIAKLPVQGLTDEELRRFRRKLDAEYKKQAPIILDALKKVTPKEREVAFDGVTLTDEESPGQVTGDEEETPRPSRAGRRAAIPAEPRHHEHGDRLAPRRVRRRRSRERRVVLVAHDQAILFAVVRALVYEPL
jgi:hypothetical protein